MLRVSITPSTDGTMHASGKKTLKHGECDEL